jgi:hypothetical protein
MSAKKHCLKKRMSKQCMNIVKKILKKRMFFHCFFNNIVKNVLYICEGLSHKIKKNANCVSFYKMCGTRSK